MPISQKILAGVMNLDDDNWDMPNTHHKRARNIKLRGNPGNMRVELALGNTSLSNTVPVGNNVCIGRYYDDINNDIYFFNYNSNATHGIYIFNTQTLSFTTLIENDTNTDGDILGFNLDVPIYNVDMIYGSPTDGNLFHFIDCDYRPKYINVLKMLNGDYGTSIKANFLDVAKQPASHPPIVATYQDDSTKTVNNLKKKLFRFATEFVYLDNNTSVNSSICEVPLPINYDGQQDEVDADPTRNNNILLIIQTGEKIVIKINVYAQQSEGLQWSDAFLVKTIIKADEGVADNSTYRFNFYNDSAYNFQDLKKSILLFDWVPIKTRAQTLPNGNVLTYGAITEGLDVEITPNVTITPHLHDAIYSNNYYTMSVTQEGETGARTGDITIYIPSIGSNPQEAATFIIHIFVDPTVFTITYTSTTLNTVADIITGLSTNASGQGFTIVSSTANELVISLTDQVLLDSNVVWDLSVNFNQQSSYVYDWASKYPFGLVYYDEKGRTNGVIYFTNVITPDYNEILGVTQIPYITASIAHRPPSWAKYFQWVRGNNSTKLKNFYYVSPQTFKDDKFAYLSLENRNQFIRENPTSADVMVYSFAPGDRVKFIKLIDINAGTATLLTNKDYDIVGEVINPSINSVVREGQFVKITLPDTDSGFDFGEGFAHYFYEVYTPANAIEDSLATYFEFGECYNIGDAGLTTRYHLGKTQSQLPDLSQTAEFIFEKGDVYYKPTDIQIGNVISYAEFGGAIKFGEITLGLNNTDQTYTNPNYLVGNSPLQDLAGFVLSTNDDRWLIKVLSGTYTFRIKGTILVNFQGFQEIYQWYLQDNTGTITQLVPPQLVLRDKDNVFTFDVTVTLNSASNAKLFAFGISAEDYDNDKTYSDSTWTITEVSDYAQGLIQRDFSVFFKSSVNSNGRPLLHDPFAGQNYFSTLARFGNEYQQATNINNTNRFYYVNFVEFLKQYGDIMRLTVREKVMRVFQKRKCGVVPVFSAIVRKQTGTNDLIATDELLNPIEYAQDNFGLNNQILSLASSSAADYFCDDVVGVQVRWANDGLTCISELYKAHYFLNPVIGAYLDDHPRTDGTIARILGFYDFFEEEFTSVFQEGIDFAGDTLAFNEQRNAYSCFYDDQPEQIICAGNDIYSWKEGIMYIRNNSANPVTYYGVLYNPSITIVFNEKVNLKKTFFALAYQANGFWISDTNGDINTSQPNPQTNLPQISNLKSVDFEIFEGLYYASYLRDANSGSDAQLAVVEGDFLKGVWIEQKLIYKGTDSVYLYLPYINYAISQRNY